MTYGLDTSVVLRIVTADPPLLANIVQTRIEEILTEGNDLFVSSVVASEAYYALQHHYLKTKEEAVVALRALSEEDGITFSAEAKAALETPEAWKASPGLVDRMITAEYSANGYITISCEKDFRKLDLTEIIA